MMNVVGIVLMSALLLALVAIVFAVINAKFINSIVFYSVLEKIFSISLHIYAIVAVVYVVVRVVAKVIS